jgi:hypothetical protein
MNELQLVDWLIKHFTHGSTNLAPTESTQRYKIIVHTKSAVGSRCSLGHGVITQVPLTGLQSVFERVVSTAQYNLQCGTIKRIFYLPTSAKATLLSALRTAYRPVLLKIEKLSFVFPSLCTKPFKLGSSFTS